MIVDPVTTYAEHVLAGKIITGKWVRLACQRHLNDLAQAEQKGLVWNLKKALHCIDFIEQMLYLEDGSPFLLEPFQKFIVGSCFGWYQTNGFRRFRTAYVEQGKGSGKTPLASAVGIYGMIADGQPAAEIYAAAVTREQALICFKDARRMVESSPEIAELVTIGVGNLAVESTHSLFRPVSSEHKALDGKRVHMAVIDELHEHLTDMVVNKMRAGTKRQRNALIFEITNSGVDRHSVCWQHHEYSIKLLQTILTDESWFAYVAGLDPCPACEAEGKDQPNPLCDECDDWRKEETWEKANPGLGTILPIEYLREQVTTAMNMPSQENIVRRLNFCQWTEQSTKFFSMDTWDNCDLAKIDMAALHGRECFAGLDLASTVDIAALVLVFPPLSTENYYTILPYFFVPEDNVAERKKRDKVDYDVWIRQGWMIATEGMVVDYDAIRAVISGPDVLRSYAPHLEAGYHANLKQWNVPEKGLQSVFKIREIVKDRWNSTQIGTQLQGDGFTVVDFGQGFASMTAPMKALEAFLKSQEINHGGNPVLRWMASNMAAAQDAPGNLKPDREKSSEKIDGIVAMLMGLARAMVTPVNKGSVYEERGLIRI